MTKPQESADRMQQEATDWFARLQSDGATGDDWLSFESWMSADTAHETAFHAVEDAWIDIEPGEDASSSAKPAQLAAEATAAVIAFPLRKRPRRVWLIPSAAAAAVLALTVGAVLQMGASGPSHLAHYPANPVSRDITLPAGGKIHLEPGAAIDLRQARNAVAATLFSGRARFEIRHDPSRRLTVTAGDAAIEDVGTVFDVSNSADAGVRLTVFEGSVGLSRVGHAGNQLSVSAGETAVSRPGEAGPRRVAADGRPLQRIYRQATLATVIEDMNQLYARPVSLTPDASALPFTGVLQMQDQDVVMRHLAAFEGLDIDGTGDRIVLRKAAKTTP